jgi:hypothetical protein
MVAILPPELQHVPTLLLIALLLGSFVLLLVALAMRRLWVSVRVCLGGIGLLSLAMLVLLSLFPSVARVERLYYQGHDQFYWGQRLHSRDPQERREAATALAALLKSSKSKVRILVIQDLGECEPEERQIALDALLAFAKDEKESKRMRWDAEYAIGTMFFQHVVGGLHTELDREPYQKIILAKGWDAAVRELASKKAAKAPKP